jgi:hypothetical protein
MLFPGEKLAAEFDLLSTVCSLLPVVLPRHEKGRMEAA